jgi:hypothetical protein
MNDQGPYVAWIQTDFGREVYEITSTPFWQVSLPYLENWRRPEWWVHVSDPTPRNWACSGQPQINVHDLHPMNDATRELLRLREGRPPSPLITPQT